jgi:WD40 repeat protein
MREQLGVTAELQTTLTALSKLPKWFLRTAALTTTSHIYITGLATEFAAQTFLPNRRKSVSPGVPRICCTRVSDHGGILACINFGSIVNSAALYPDGARVVVGSSDGSVCIWDATIGVEVRTLEGHTGEVKSVAFSADYRAFSRSRETNSCDMGGVKPGVTARVSLRNSVNWMITESSQERLFWLPRQIHVGIRISYCTAVIFKQDTPRKTC